MFGLSKMFKKVDPIKAVCNNTNFFDVMSKDLNEAKEKASASAEISNEKYEEIIAFGIEAFKNFILSEGFDKDSFQNATKTLVEASEMKPSKPESYYYLSCLFHICGENETALKYLKTVEFINPDFDGIVELKSDITKGFSLEKDLSPIEEQETSKELTNEEIENIEFEDKTKISSSTKQNVNNILKSNIVIKPKPTITVIPRVVKPIQPSNKK
jgi:hypothetical protein